MAQHTPLRFDPTFETVPDDEGATQQGLTEAMLGIQRKTHADTGYAHRAVHAKAHGYLRARFEVLAGLPPALAQGLFASPAAYDAVLRFSTTPGDVLHDGVSTPRGAALKVLGVPGARLPGSEGETTQNYVLGNSPSFQIGTAKSFLRQLKPLAATTGRAEPVKKVLSAMTRISSMIERQAGDPISPSLVNRPTSGAGAPPTRWKAARTKAFITSPTFISATPGP